MAKRVREKIPAALVLQNPVCLLAFGFGSGLAPFAPGTFGTLAAVPLWLLASYLSLPVYLALTALMFVVGIYLCGQCEQIIGSQDHSGIVWDEFVGLFITLAAIPAEPVPLIAGFTLFRLFDVLKPWPIGWADLRIHGGLGIMLDDALAGVLAWGSLNGLIRLGWV
jgi:phosphatidylglycerophosphatase A